MKAFTDASVFEGKGIHSYVLYDKNGEILLMDRARSNITDSLAAEMISVIAILMKCGEQSFKNVSVFTDCKPIVSFIKKKHKKGEKLSKGHRKYATLIATIKRLLNSIGGVLRWIRRRENVIADRLCDEAKDKIFTLKEINFKKEPIVNDGKNEEPAISDSNTISILDERVLTNHLSIGGVSKETVSKSDIVHIWQYYCSMIIKSSRKDIGTLLKWGEVKQHRNSKVGRRYFVECFIAENHIPKDLNFTKTRHAFEIK